MVNRLIGTVMAGGTKLAAQVVVSVVATGCAAVVVPQLLPKLGYQVTASAPMAMLAAPVADFEAVFVPPPQPQPLESALVDPQRLPVVAARVETVTQTSRLQAAGARAYARRAEARRAPSAAPTPAPRPGEPLELAAMTQPAPAEPSRPRVFGLTIPRIPFEDKVAGTVSMARSAVARVFN